MTPRIINLAEVRQTRLARKRRMEKRYTPVPLDPQRMARVSPRDTWRDHIANRFPPLPDTLSLIAALIVAIGYWVILP